MCVVTFPEVGPRGLVKRSAAAALPFGPATLADILDHGVATHPDRLALIDGDNQWTYAELNAQVTKRAVNVQTPPGAGFWLSEERFTAESLMTVLAGMRVGAVWFASKTNPDVATIGGIVRNESLPRPSDAAVVAFTSGTTGTPKKVVHSHQSMLLPASITTTVTPRAEGERIGTPLDLRIANVMILGPLSAFVRGSTFVVMSDRTAPGMATDIERHGITDLFAVPTLAHDLLHCGDIESDQLKTLRHVVLGGAGAAPELIEGFADRFGVRPIRSYGFSEAPTGVARESLDDPITAGRGHPLPHVQIVVRNPTTGEEVDCGEVGEICVTAATHGPWAHCWTGAMGYLDQPERSEQLFRDGVLHTGDLGTLDTDGAVRVTGRLGDLIVRGGANIDPRALEASLEALVSVSAAAVVGIDDDRLGQRVGAVLQAEANATRDTIDEEIMASAVRLDAWVVVSKLPRTDMGKLDRHALRSLLEP